MSIAASVALMKCFPEDGFARWELMLIRFLGGEGEVNLNGILIKRKTWV